jgi:phage portal protein BeeE
MPGVLDRIADARPARRPPALAGEVLPRGRSWLDYASILESYSFGGNSYTAIVGSGGNQTEERIEANFRGLVEGAYKRHGPVFACMVVRMLAFAEARFMYRQLRSGRPGDLFSMRQDNGGDLDILRRPWRGGTTGDLLTRMILDADVAGNAFIARRPGRLRRLRPDWVTIVMGSTQDADTVAQQAISGDDLDADVLGYIYAPDTGPLPEVLLPDEVAHFAPLPDPVSNYRGISWLTPVIQEIGADQAATQHKLKFFERGAALQTVVSLDKDISPEAFDEFVARFRATHEGVENAYKTLFLGGGADVTTVTANMQEIEMKALQGVSETRIAAAARVHPVVVGFSEGLAGSALNAGNYKAALRNFADLTMRPLWRNAAGSLESIIQVPSDAELWYDDRDIAFLREDAKDAAEIFQMEAAAYRTLVDAGVNPDAAADALAARDIRRVVGNHSGLFSVQLQPPQPNGTPALPVGSGG